MNKILWNSIKSPLRYFWVPAGEDVFTGEYKIENGDGEEASVDLESIVPFEINDQEAEAIMMNELETMTNELGGLFKDLFKLGKRMVNSDLMDDDSEDWDSEEDSDSEDSDWDSEDSDFDEADLDKIISLFDSDSEEDSDEDSESSSDFDASSIEDLLSQFGDGLEGPLTELRDLIVQEVGTLSEELDKLGSEAAKQLDSEPGSGQDILRELGQWLINLADDRAEDADEDVVVMEFKPKDTEGQSIDESTTPDSELHVEDAANEDNSEEDSSSEDSSESDEDSSNEEDSKEDYSASNEEINTSKVDQEIEGDTSETVEPSTDKLPSESVLKRMTKAQLIDLGQTFGLTLIIKDTKKTLLEQLETIR